MSSDDRIYHHPILRHVDIPNLDLLALLFESEHSIAPNDTVLHVEAANPDNKITKGQTIELIERICHGLRFNYALSSVGPKKEVVTVITYGQILNAAALYGVIAAGGIYSGASPSSTFEEMNRQVEICQSRVIICGAEHKDLAARVAKHNNVPLRNVLLLDSTAGAWSLKSIDGTVNAMTEDRIPWPRIRDFQILKDSVVAILWSSGTTGLPKGVEITHHNFVTQTYVTSLSPRAWAAKEIEKGTLVPKQASLLAHLPVSHLAGLIGYLILPMYNAACVVWMRRYVWEDLLKYLKQYKITNLYTVPSIWLRITKSPDVTDQFKSLEAATTGSAPMDGELMKSINRKVGDGTQKMIGQTWGLSETTGAVAAMLKGDGDADDTGCIGRILPAVDVRLVDDDYNDIDPQTQEGELLIRSPLVMKGYYDNPEATKAAFQGEWFCTGDVAVLRNGLFYIVDRKKELLKYKGLQVAPAEIEKLLISNPAISEAAVVGIPSPDDPGTDLTRAYVIRAPGQEIGADEVKKFVLDHLAPYKQLRGGVVFVDELPKNVMGKTLRKDLRQRARQEVSSERRTARESKL